MCKKFRNRVVIGKKEYKFVFLGIHEICTPYLMSMFLVQIVYLCKSLTRMLQISTDYLGANIIAKITLRNATYVPVLT